MGLTGLDASGVHCFWGACSQCRSEGCELMAARRERRPAMLQVAEQEVSVLGSFWRHLTHRYLYIVHIFTYTHIYMYICLYIHVYTHTLYTCNLSIHLPIYEPIHLFIYHTFRRWTHKLHLRLGTASCSLVYLGASKNQEP